MKKVVRVLALLSLILGCSTLGVFANNRPFQRVNCTIFGNGNQDPFGGLNLPGLVTFGDDDQPTDSEDDSDSMDEEEEDDTTSVEARLVAQLEIRTLQVILNNLTIHVGHTANNNLAPAFQDRYTQAAADVERDFAQIQRGANYAAFQAALQTEINGRIAQLNTQQIHLTEVELSAEPNAWFGALTRLLDRTLEAREANTNGEDTSEVRIWHVIYDQMLSMLYKKLANQPNVSFREYYQQEASNIAGETFGDLLMALDSFQFSIERRIHLWVNRQVLRGARGWIEDELQAIGAGNRGDFADRFEEMGGQGSFENYRNRADYDAIGRAVADYVITLEHQMGIPSWVAFDLTQEEREEYIEAINAAIQNSLDVYLQAQDNFGEQIESQNSLYTRRLLVRASLAFFYDNQGNEEESSVWSAAAIRDLIRSLGAYRKVRLVSLSSVGPGVYSLGHGGILSITIMPQANSTQAYR